MLPFRRAKHQSTRLGIWRTSELRFRNFSRLVRKDSTARTTKLGGACGIEIRSCCILDGCPTRSPALEDHIDSAKNKKSFTRRVAVPLYRTHILSRYSRRSRSDDQVLIHEKYPRPISKSNIITISMLISMLMLITRIPQQMLICPKSMRPDIFFFFFIQHA